MFKDQRQKAIYEILKEEKFASVSELSKRLYFSLPTVRRDLTELERQGLIRRSHGGAVAAEHQNSPPLSFRSGTHLAEKLRICRLAATLVSPGMLIFADASSTAMHLAETLQKIERITVLTNGLPACGSFLQKGTEVISTGGRLLRDSQAFVGESARQTVLRYHADMMFFSSSSLGTDGMISDYSEEENTLRWYMAKQAEKLVFLCDSGKPGTRSPFNLFSLAQVDYAITGAPLPEEILRVCPLHFIRENGAFLYGKKCKQETE